MIDGLGSVQSVVLIGGTSEIGLAIAEKLKENYEIDIKIIIMVLL